MIGKVAEEISQVGEDSASSFEELKTDIETFGASITTLLHELKHNPLTGPELAAISTDMKQLSDIMTKRHVEVVQNLHAISKDVNEVKQEVLQMRVMLQLYHNNTSRLDKNDEEMR